MVQAKVERISNWMVAGPFDNPKKDGRRIGLDVAYPPEETPFDRDASFRGKDNAEVSWKNLDANANGFFEISTVIADSNSVAYACTKLITEKAGKAMLDFAPYVGIKVFVNGRCIGRVEPPAEGLYRLKRGMGLFEAELKAGENELLVKIEHEEGAWGFYFRAPMARPTFHEYMLKYSKKLAKNVSKPPLDPALIKRWQKGARKKLIELMGFPRKKVKTRIKSAEKADCGSYVRELFYFLSEENFWVPAYLFTPKSAKPEGRCKALLSLHGHGKGKSDIAGLYESEEDRKKIPGYDYSHRFAENGYVVLTIDSRSFGELGDLPCQRSYAMANALGRPLVGMRVWDGLRALDILEAQREVDPKRIGCTGLSWGGTHTSYLTMIDPRIKAALVSGYFSTFEDILYREASCPCQYLPKVAELFDFPELLFGLACPRPLYIQNGLRDELYTPSEVTKAFNRGRKIYKAMGVARNAVLEMHPDFHEYKFEPALAWFENVL